MKLFGKINVHNEETLATYLAKFPPKTQAFLLKSNLDTIIKKFKQFVDEGESKEKAFDSLIEVVDIIEQLEKKC